MPSSAGKSRIEIAHISARQLLKLVQALPLLNKRKTMSAVKRARRYACVLWWLPWLRRKPTLHDQERRFGVSHWTELVPSGEIENGQDHPILDVRLTLLAPYSRQDKVMVKFIISTRPRYNWLAKERGWPELRHHQLNMFCCAEFGSDSPFILKVTLIVRRALLRASGAFWEMISRSLCKEVRDRITKFSTRRRRLKRGTLHIIWAATWMGLARVGA